VEVYAVGRLLRVLSLLLCLSLIVPAWAQDEKKDAKDKAEPKKDAKEDPKEKPEPKKDKDAKDSKDSKSDAKDKPEPKEKLVSVGKLSGVKLIRKPAAQPSMTISILVARDRWQNQDVPVGDDLVVRVLNPPVVFDEKGRVKRYSKKELDELKGPDKKLPGYQASIDDLKEGQLIEVYLYRKPGGPKNFKGTDIPPEYKPHVGMVVILGASR
jgi:hypothetical protein